MAEPSAERDPDASGVASDEDAADTDASEADLAATVADVFERVPGVDYGERAHLDAAGQPRIIERRFVVEPEVAGLRLDHYLVKCIPRLSRTRLRAVIATQLHRDRPGPLKPHTPVVAGEVYTIRRPARAEPPCPRTIDVLYDDPDVLVVAKPAGLPVHATAKFYFNTLTRVLAERFPDQPLQICHRLDRETSGALVVARGRAAASVIKHAFATKRVQKTYLAIVRGDPPWPDAGAGGEHVIDIPLVLAQPGDPTRLPHVRMLPREGGLPSTTRVVVEQRAGGRYALVRCTPVTGRQHQIRAHLAATGYPIVGDKLYAAGDDAFIEFCDKGFTPALRAQLELPRQALHAASVVFPHPTRAAPVRVDAPLAADLARFLERAIAETEDAVRG